MTCNRVGGTSRRSGNPPAIVFSRDFTPTGEMPTPFDVRESQEAAANAGFSDAWSCEAEFLFQRVSYQHASEYFDSFPDRRSLAMLHRAILFDRKMQSLLMEYIGLFELQFRAQYSRLLSLRHGPFAHRDPSNFRNQEYFNKFLDVYQDEFNNQLRQRNTCLREAFERYGDVPTWLAVEIMSFGTLSKLYNNTRDTVVTRGVADSFGVHQDALTSWTRALTVARNKCAHFSRLFGRPLSSIPRTISGLGGDNSSAFYLILILVRLLNDNVVFESDASLCYWMSLVNAAANLIYRFGDIALRCGIPENWNKLLSDRLVTSCDLETLPPIDAVDASGLPVTRVDICIQRIDEGTVYKIPY